METEQKEREWVYSFGEFYCAHCGAKATKYVGDLRHCMRCGTPMAAPWERERRTK